jgi:mannose-6-phosphate isomerase-like protein (cupin superfamily)
MSAPLSKAEIWNVGDFNIALLAFRKAPYSMTNEIPTGSTAHLSAASAATRIQDGDSVRSVPVFRHGTLLVKYYAPRGDDPQTPHSRDELYVVAHGQGVFFNGTSRVPFGPGDLLFAAAGALHRFEDFTDDFGVWVMFYGPENGEAA